MPSKFFLHCAMALVACLTAATYLEAMDSPNPSSRVAPSRSISKPVQPFTGFVGSRNEVPMALIPAGEFAMGSDRGQDDEQPVHRVLLRAFYLDAHEVTVAHFAEFMNSQKPDPPFKWN